jgi:hypothetical protein
MICSFFLHQNLSLKIKYTQGNFELARTYYSYALKLNPNNMRALYGLLLCANNLKTAKSKELFNDNAKLATWASEELLSKYKVRLPFK